MVAGSLAVRVRGPSGRRPAAGATETVAFRDRHEDDGKRLSYRRPNWTVPPPGTGEAEYAMSTTTSQQNRERIEVIYDALASNDVETFVDALADDVVWREAEGFPTSTADGVFEGPDAVVDGVLGYLGSEFESFEIHPERFVADEDTVAAVGDYHGTHAETEESFTTRFVHVWDLEDGQVSRFEQIADSALVRTVVPE